MEITEIETILLSHTLEADERWYVGDIRGVKADTAILRVHTDEGITGLGEPTPYAGAREIEAAVESLEPALLGEDPFDVGRLGWESGSSNRRGRETYAMAGVDMACWDIVGKAVGQPVCKLLGAQYDERIPVYASGGIDWRDLGDPDLFVEEAESYLEAGFEAFKFRVGPDERFVPAIDRLHEAVGDDLGLIVEGNARFDTPAEAVRMARRFAEHDPLWFEEPIDTSDLQGYREVRRGLPDVPVSGGESAESTEQLKPWLDRRAYDIVQPDANVMGLTEAKRAADLARLEGIDVTPHNWHNAVTTAANLHLVAAIPNSGWIELQRTAYWGCEAFRTEIVEDPIPFEDGHLVVPEEPGLGVTLDEDAIERYPFEDGPNQVAWEDSPL